MTLTARTERGPAIGRPTDADLTRRILEVTAELLIVEGYASLRIERVARAAQCGKAAIYRRYADKASLVAAAISVHLEVGAVPDTGALRTDLLEHAQQNQRNLDGSDLAVRRGMQAMFEPDVFPLLWDQFFRFRRDQGAQIISRALGRGELPADADPDVILDTIAGLTLYRQSVKGLRIDERHYLAVIDALIAHPPRRLAGAERTDHS